MLRQTFSLMPRTRADPTNGPVDAYLTNTYRPSNAATIAHVPAPIARVPEPTNELNDYNFQHFTVPYQCSPIASGARLNAHALCSTLLPIKPSPSNQRVHIGHTFSFRAKNQTGRNKFSTMFYFDNNAARVCVSVSPKPLRTQKTIHSRVHKPTENENTSIA